MWQLKRAFGALEAKIRGGSSTLALAALDALLCSSPSCWLSLWGAMLHSGVTTRAQQCPPDPRAAPLQVTAKPAFSGTSSVENLVDALSKGQDVQLCLQSRLKINKKLWIYE